jgi:CubicO group peptidase (beta-lactamase class C family)
MRHRVGSITKAFTAAAVLQQVESGEIGLDTPIGHYLPQLVPAERGHTITVRMLINHTRGLAEIVNRSSLAQMQRAVPVISFEGKKIAYGFGLHKMEVPGHGTFWGHDGTVWGAGAMSVTRADGKRQMSVAVNLMRWNNLDVSGKPRHHPIDDALPALYQLAMCGSGNTP